MNPQTISPQSLALGGVQTNGAGVMPPPQFNPTQAPTLNSPGVQTATQITPSDPMTAGQDPNASLVTGGNATPQTAPTMASLMGSMGIPTNNTNAGSALNIPAGTNLYETNIKADSLPSELSVADANTLTQQTGGYDPALAGGQSPVSMTPAQAAQYLNSQSLNQPSLGSIFGTNQNVPAANVATPTDITKASNKSQLDAAAGEVFGADQVPYIDSIVNAESGFNAQAQNPKSSASGMFQFLSSTTANKAYGLDQYKSMAEAPLAAQIQAGLTYIKNRYGTPQAAWAFHKANGWY